jgi:superfamily II DNA or RNA helicase
MSSMLYIPIQQAGNVDELRERLTIKVRQEGEAEAEYATVMDGDEGVTLVTLYDESIPGYIGVPRAWGADKFRHLSWVNRTSWPTPRPHLFPQTIKPRDDQQREFMRELANICNGARPIDYVANAKTGSGKTVSDLATTAKLGVPTLVTVPLNKLKDQWYGNFLRKQGILYFFGNEWTKKYVGIVQQDRCDYRGKLIVLGMLPSLARRDYGPEFYRYFGKLTIDEVHTAAAPLLSQALKRFPMAIRGGYTATNREDALKKVITYHLGRPKVESSQEVPRPRVFIVPFKLTTRLQVFNERMMLTSICFIEPRNEMLTRLIYERSWKRGRHTVVLSDRTEQLQILQKSLMMLGIPQEHVGLYVGSYYTGKIVASVVGHGKKKRFGVFDNVREANAAAREAGVAIVCKQQKINTPNEELERIKDHSRIILATYGIFGTGTDIPRLDQGIEASPRRNVVQSIGRILRKDDGRVREWIGIADRIRRPEWRSLPKDEQYYEEIIRWSEMRMNSYRKQNADIRHVPSKS